MENERKRWRQLCFHPSKHLLNVNNKNPRKRCEVCSKLTIKTSERRQCDVVLVSFLLTLNILHTFFLCYYYWLWTAKCSLGIDIHITRFSVSSFDKKGFQIHSQWLLFGNFRENFCGDLFFGIFRNFQRS